MRIVAVADTHLFHHELAVPDGDVFVHAGDLCRVGDLDELRECAAWIRALRHRVKIVVAGNHDWAFVTHPQEARSVLGPEVVYLEDHGVTVEGIRFWGSPWQPAFQQWAFNLERGQAVAAKWSLIPRDVDVLITHGPPLGFGDGPRLGCSDLLDRVRRIQPRVHLFGHIHEGSGVWREGGTSFINVTTAECERGATVIVLDPSDKCARPDIVQ